MTATGKNATKPPCAPERNSPQRRFDVKTPDYIEPILQAVKPFTLTGARDSASHVAWQVDKALDAAGYAIVSKKSIASMQRRALDRYDRALLRGE